MESGSALPREEIVAGAVAGLAAGVVLAALTRPRDTTTAGLLELGPSQARLALHLVLAVLLGGAFGAIVRHRPRAYAAAISGGLLLGLLRWMAGWGAKTLFTPLVRPICRQNRVWRPTRSRGGYGFAIGRMTPKN